MMPSKADPKTPVLLTLPADAEKMHPSQAPRGKKRRKRRKKKKEMTKK
jgi:hypothetical protein